MITIVVIVIMTLSPRKVWLLFSDDCKIVFCFLMEMSGLL